MRKRRGKLTVGSNATGEPHRRVHASRYLAKRFDSFIPGELSDVHMMAPALMYGLCGTAWDHGAIAVRRWASELASP